MDDALHGRWLESVRKHRHDVLNLLQVAQGYLQLQRPEVALSSLRQLSDWLNSLSALQSAIRSTETPVYQAALTCPHVFVRRFACERVLTEAESDCVADLLEALDERAAEVGALEISVVLRTATEPDPSLYINVQCPQGFCTVAQDRISTEVSRMTEAGARVYFSETNPV